MTSVDSANRHLSHYIQYMQPQSSLLQLAATEVYRQSLQSGHDAARVSESCLFDACGEYAALFVSTASGFKGAGCPKIQESVFFRHARFIRRFCILLVFRATAETRGITAETRGITAETGVQRVDVLRAFGCAA